MTTVSKMPITSLPGQLTADQQYELDQKLIQLGRQVIQSRIYAQREAAFKRDIVNCVFNHISASAGELQERLREIMEARGRHDGPTERDIFEVAKARR